MEPHQKSGQKVLESSRTKLGSCRGQSGHPHAQICERILRPHLELREGGDTVESGGWARGGSVSAPTLPAFLLQGQALNCGKKKKCGSGKEGHRGHTDLLQLGS